MAPAISAEKRAALADAEALRRRIDDLRTRVRGRAGLAFDPVRQLANAAEDLPTEAMAYGTRTADDLREIVAQIAAEVDEIERDYVSPELPAPAKEPAEADLLDVPILVPGEAWRYEVDSDGWDTPWRLVTLRAGEVEGAAYRGMVSTTGGASKERGTFHVFEWPDGQRAAQRAGMSPPSRDYGDRNWRVRQRKEQNVANNGGFRLGVQDGRTRKRAEQPRLAGTDVQVDTKAMYEQKVRGMAKKAGAARGLAGYNERMQAAGLPRVRTIGEAEAEQAAPAEAAASPAPEPEPGPVICERCGVLLDAPALHIAIGTTECPAGTSEFRPATPAEVAEHRRREVARAKPPRPGSWRGKQNERAAKQAERATKREAEEAERAAKQAERAARRHAEKVARESEKAERAAKRQADAAERERKKAEPAAKPKIPRFPSPPLLAALAVLAAQEDAAGSGPVDWVGPEVNDRLRARAIADGYARLEESGRHFGPRYWITLGGRNVLAMARENAKRPPPKPRRKDPIALRFARFVKDSGRTSWTDKQSAKNRAENDWLYAAHVAADLVRERPRSIEAIVRDGDQELAHGRRPGSRVGSDVWREVMRDLAAGRYIEPTAVADEYRRTREVLPFEVTGSRVIYEPREAEHAFSVNTARQRLANIGPRVRQTGDPALIRELEEAEQSVAGELIGVSWSAWNSALATEHRLERALDDRRRHGVTLPAPGHDARGRKVGRVAGAQKQAPKETKARRKPSPKPPPPARPPRTTPGVTPGVGALGGPYLAAMTALAAQEDAAAGAAVDWTGPGIDDELRDRAVFFGHASTEPNLEGPRGVRYRTTPTGRNSLAISRKPKPASPKPAAPKPTTRAAKPRPRQEPARVRGDKIVAATIREYAKEPRGLVFTTGDGGFVVVERVGGKWGAFRYQYGPGAGIKEGGPPENYKRALERAVAMGGDITVGAPVSARAAAAVEEFVKLVAQAKQAPRTRPLKPAKDKAAKKKPAKKKPAKKKPAKKINPRALARGTAIELAEHPTIDKKQARQLARDHLRENPAAYRGKRAPKSAKPKPATVKRPSCAGSIDRLKARYEVIVARRAGRLTTRQAARRDALLARQQARERTLAGRAAEGSPRSRVQARARLKDIEKQHKQQRIDLHRREAAELDALKRKAECYVLNRAQVAKAVRLGCGELCHLNVAGGIGGDQAMVALPSARSAPRTLPARFVLVSAASLIASHDPTTFDPRSDYPSKVQERRYERDNLEKGKVISIAQNMLPALIENTNPGAVDGTPIITTSGIVLSGNGRTMGTQRHYLSGRRVLAEWLERHAAQFGIDPRAVRTFKDPIIVRVVDVPAAEWGRLVRDFNVSLTQRMSAEVEAAALARQLPPDVPRLLRDGGADAGVAEYLASRASLPLVGALERSGYITSANRSRLLGGDGLLSVDGRGDFERMMVAAVLPVEVIERSPELAKALDRSAVSWLAAAGAGPDWDVRADLAAAAEDYLAMRAANSCLAQWQEQASMVIPATQGRPMARTLLEILVMSASRPVVFGRIAAAFAASSRGAGQLFGSVDPLEALKQAAASGGVEPARAMSRQRCRKAA